MSDVTEGRPEEEELAVLEAIISALMGAGSPRRRLSKGLRLLRERLKIVQTMVAQRTHASGDSTVTAVSLPLTAHEPLAGTLSGAGATHIVTGLVGNSPAMRAVYEAIRRVSHTQATVLLRGESGTGKELAAKAIHRSGPRAHGPFVPLHCAAVSETLLESELFGHERGAFTGAVEMRKGRFELAERGTLFLDEIGDIPLSTQVKLLRVLQDKCFERVGGSQTHDVDVRLISATHRNLEEMVASGTFREDLYYRLNVVPITIPPLRERPEDVPVLIEYFLSKYNKQNRRHVRLSSELVELMTGYHWPGNVRELQNCIERLVVMADAEMVTLGTIPHTLRGYFADMQDVSQTGPSPETLTGNLETIERDRLKKALERAGWVQARAARVLGITPRQIAYRIRKYKLLPDVTGMS